MTIADDNAENGGGAADGDEGDEEEEEEEEEYEPEEPLSFKQQLEAKLSGATPPARKKKKKAAKVGEPSAQPSTAEGEEESRNAEQEGEEEPQGDATDPEARPRAPSTRSTKSTKSTKSSKSKHAAGPPDDEPPSSKPKSDIFDEPEDNDPFASSGKGLFKSGGLFNAVESDDDTDLFGEPKAKPKAAAKQPEVFLLFLPFSLILDFPNSLRLRF